MISIGSFAKSLAQCYHGSGNIVVGLSGGVDSMCLTYLLTKYRDLYQPDMKISAVTIDHQYRPKSGSEASEIGNIVREWGVDHQIRKLTYGGVSAGSITNFEETARGKRYQVFQNVCNDLGATDLFVAHTYDDQIETYLQRVQQNSTIFGLRGLKQRSLLPLPPPAPFKYKPPIMVLRPLLAYTKAQIIETCKDNKIPWFEDLTNQDIHLTERNLYRYLINDYIPKHPKNHEIISKENLKKSHNAVLELTDQARTQINYLKEKYQNRIFLQPKNSIIELNLDYDDIDSLALSRFLYELMYPISPSKNYHWSYSKMLNNFMPKFLEFLDSDKVSTKLTYVNVLFEIKKSSTIYLKLSRQPIIRSNVPEIKLTLGATDLNKWILFDTRYWLLFNTNIPDVRIEVVPYESRVHRKLLTTQYGSGKVPKKIIPGTPVVKVNDLYALPTHELIPHEIEIEWHLKDNIYSIS